MQQNQDAGFAGLGSLLDFGFQKFITLSVIKVLYMLGAGVIALGLILGMISAFLQNGAIGVLVLGVGPLVALVALVFLRVWLELVVVIFRIGDHTGKLVQQGSDAVASLTSRAAA